MSTGCYLGPGVSHLSHGCPQNLCIFNLGPRAVIMLRAPRYLNPALTTITCHLLDYEK